MVVRFHLNHDAVPAFDRLAAEVVEAVREREPGTLVYAVHRVEGQPDLRVFYELYRDQAAFEEHEAQEHTRRFLAAREELFTRAPEVDFLEVQAGKGLPRASV